MARPPVLTPQAEDFPRWYQDVIAKAELADNGPVRGTMVIRPYGYSIWERMQAEMDARLKAQGTQNAYFPLFIPESYLKREVAHVEGFSPELAIVTIAGGKELEEPIVVRPTSETVIGEYMGKWVQSYRDLPLLLNQWANVVRWELRPRLFLRTSEFLWQEGHTAHANQADAAAYARTILHEAYADFMRTVLAVPVFVGRKTVKERFAGAINTMTCEAMTRDGKALQMGTSHELGQNFSKVFDIGYLGAGGERELCWTTSFGTSTRMVGGLIMVHGDDAGLRVPPTLAPIQVAVIPVKPETLAAAGSLAASLRGVGLRVSLDSRVETAFGRRAVDWELKGVPVRLELGPRDVSAGTVVIASRLTGSKTTVSLGAVETEVRRILGEDQDALFSDALAFRDSRVTDVSSVAEAAAVVEETAGWARIPWAACGATGEDELARSSLTVRCLMGADGGVPESDADEGAVALIAKAY